MDVGTRWTRSRLFIFKECLFLGVFRRKIDVETTIIYPFKNHTNLFTPSLLGNSTALRLKEIKHETCPTNKLADVSYWGGGGNQKKKIFKA